MDTNYFWHLFKTKKLSIFFAWFIFIILGSAVTFLQPLKYEAKSRLLIVQNVAGIDPYTISKSNQYLSNLFAQIVHSNSFFELVTSSNNFDIDKNYFESSYKKQMEIWGKTISANSLNDTGIVEISIYHPNPYQAKELALAANDALINQGFNYQGGGDTIKVKIIDQPLVSDYPVKPNIIFNLIAFSVLGLIAGSSYIYFFDKKSLVITIKNTSNQITKNQYIRENIVKEQGENELNSNTHNSNNNHTNNHANTYHTNNPNTRTEYRPQTNLSSNKEQLTKISGNINNLLPRF